jgi:hypothetical protein
MKSAMRRRLDQEAPEQIGGSLLPGSRDRRRVGPEVGCDCRHTLQKCGSVVGGDPVDVQPLPFVQITCDRESDSCLPGARWSAEDNDAPGRDGQLSQRVHLFVAAVNRVLEKIERRPTAGHGNGRFLEIQIGGRDDRHVRMHVRGRVGRIHAVPPDRRTMPRTRTTIAARRPHRMIDG